MDEEDDETRLGVPEVLRVAEAPWLLGCGVEFALSPLLGLNKRLTDDLSELDAEPDDELFSAFITIGVPGFSAVALAWPLVLLEMGPPMPLWPPKLSLAVLPGTLKTVCLIRF